MAAYVLLRCDNCSPNFSVRHRVEIIQGPYGTFARYTCLSCDTVTDQEPVDDIRKSKLYKDSDEEDEEE